MIAPTIHLNGSSAQDLTDSLDKAVSALRVAIDAVGDCQPNGRDYYPQGTDAIGQATREHVSRLERVTAVRKELEALRELIQDQLDQR